MLRNSLTQFFNEKTVCFSRKLNLFEQRTFFSQRLSNFRRSRKTKSLLFQRMFRKIGSISRILLKSHEKLKT